MKRPHDKESRVLIACHTIEDELNLAIRATGFTHPVFWVAGIQSGRVIA